MSKSIEDLKRFSDDGDQNAKRIMNEIERFWVQKEQQVNEDIKSVIGDITTMLSNPTAVTGRDVAVPHAVAELANEWANLISPVDENTEIIG